MDNGQSEQAAMDEQLGTSGNGQYGQLPLKLIRPFRPLPLVHYVHCPPCPLPLVLVHNVHIKK